MIIHVKRQTQAEHFSHTPDAGRRHFSAIKPAFFFRRRTMLSQRDVSLHHSDAYWLDTTSVDTCTSGSDPVASEPEVAVKQTCHWCVLM